MPDGVLSVGGAFATMHDSIQPIEQLVRRARAGDSAALGELLDAHRPYLRLIAERLLDRRVGARLDASDLIQQTCLSVHKRMEEFIGEEGPEFIAWLRQIHERNIQNAMRDHLHAQKRGVSREAASDPEKSPGAERALSRETSPSQRLLLGESAVALAGALEQIPDDQREAVRLRYIEGRPLTEIALELNRSREAVAGLLKRGLQALRTLLREVE